MRPGGKNRPIEQRAGDSAETVPVSADLQLTAPSRERFAALAVPTFRAYLITSAISSAGDSMETAIRNWLVWELTHSPFWLGMMTFAHWIPFTLFSLYGGVLADRYDNRKIQLVAQALLTLAALGVAVATLGGFVNEWWIFGLLLLHGFAGAIGGPAQQTLIHSIVGRNRLLSAVSLNATMRQVVRVVGPAVAGYVLLVFGAGFGFLVNALTFLPLILVLLLIRVPRVIDSGPPQTVRESFVEGVRFIRSRPAIASLLAIQVLPVLLLGDAFSALLPVFATDVLHSNELGYGFLLAGSASGAFVAALVLGSLPDLRRKGLVIVTTAAIEMAAIFLFALSNVYALSLLLLVAVGATTVLTQALTNTAIQLSVPDRIRGRAMGAYSFATQGMHLANGPALGAAALVFGAPAAVGASALIVLAALGVIVARVPLPRAVD